MILEIPMPKIVLNCTLTPNQGKYSFDPVSKVLLWDIGRIDVSKLPNLRGSVCKSTFEKYATIVCYNIRKLHISDYNTKFDNCI